VTISNFGVFAGLHRAGRQGRNPATGEALTIPAKTAPARPPGPRAWLAGRAPHTIVMIIRARAAHTIR
jgi:hypothetical protein